MAIISPDIQRKTGSGRRNTSRSSGWNRTVSRIRVYIEYQLGLDIERQEISFGTKDEEFNGRHSVRVVWIGKKSDPNLSLSAARFFGAPHINADNPGEELAF